MKSIGSSAHANAFYFLMVLLFIENKIEKKRKNQVEYRNYELFFSCVLFRWCKRAIYFYFILPVFGFGQIGKWKKRHACGSNSLQHFNIIARGSVAHQIYLVYAVHHRIRLSKLWKNFTILCNHFIEFTFWFVCVRCAWVCMSVWVCVCLYKLHRIQFVCLLVFILLVIFNMFKYTWYEK